MISIKKEVEDVKIKVEDIDANCRRDPTSFLPEEEMSYEIKKKKKKKKKKRQEDPFKDLDEKAAPREPVTIIKESALDPEVNIKVENIEVELDFNDFADNSGLMVEGLHSEDSQEPEVKIEPQNHEAVLLTFESIINDRNVLGYTQETQTAVNHVCKICHLIFQSATTLKSHQKRKHQIFRKAFENICDHCGMSYDQKNSLVAHIKRKHGPNTEDDREERACEICSLVFKGMNRLRMHMRRKHDSFQDTFNHKCKHCGLTYDKYRSLIVHIQRKHSNKKKPVSNQWYNCPFCPKIFSKRETYVRHVQRKHQINENGDLVEDTVGLDECINETTGEITCKECPLVFSSLTFLKLHMRRKHNALKEDFRLKCRICHLSYDKVESLKRHVRRKHDKKTYCDVCNKQFDTTDAYLNHTHMKPIMECTICGLIFASQGGLAKHLRCTHKMDKPKTVFCNLCNEGFSDKRNLKPHIMRVHLNVSYTCTYCKKVFKAKESYRRHVIFQHQVKHDFNNPVHNCEHCTDTFQDENELCKHISIMHSNSNTEKPVNLFEIKKEEGVDVKESYQCTKCPDVYLDWDQLKLHYAQNHYTVEETQCQVCGNIVPKNDLSKHMKSEHTPTMLNCKYCEFSSPAKASMTQHLLRHKNATTLNCDFSGCRYKTFYEDAMTKHKRKHADLGLKLQCARCGFQTMNKYILRYHEEAHATGKKRYTCNLCNYSTILPANLVQHKYKHSTVKRFKCEFCPFATKYNTSLRFHVKNKHCDLPAG